LRKASIHTSGQEGSVEKESRQLPARLDQLESEGKGSHSSLDIDIIRRATDVLSGNYDGAPVHKSGSAGLTSGSWRGDLWLDLSKDLTRKIHCGDSAQTLASAQTAAQRATMILMHSLVEPSSVTGSNNPVDAEDASDALALKYWLDCMDSKPNEDSNVEVQRALLICPGKPVAQSALSLPVVGCNLVTWFS
jgi:hypothetical protein